MRQAVTLAPGEIDVVDVDLPPMRPSEVLVEVAATGICGSDINLFRGRHPYGDYPLVQGHEIVGTVVDTGDTTGVPVGMRVAIDPVVACGACVACRRGHPNACTSIEVLGVHRAGGFAETVAVEAGNLHAIGDLPFDIAVLAEPFAVAMHALERGSVSEGDRLVVLGAGSIGRAVALAAVDRGLEVLVVGREQRRLDLVRRLGVRGIVDTDAARLASAVHEFTGSDGPSVVVEATGAPAVAHVAMELVAPGGTVVIVGVSDEPLGVPLSIFSRKELTVRGSRNSAGQFPAAIDLISRRSEALAGVVSHRYPLVSAARALGAAGLESVTKAIITPCAGMRRATRPVVAFGMPSVRMDNRTMPKDALRLTAVDRNPNLYEVVSQQLVAAIHKAGLPPGTRIPSERDLGEQFGVSRTVIREAIRHLAAKGVLEARSGSGIVVADVGHENVSESIELFLASRGPIEPAKLQEVRLGLELQTVALAAERATDEQLAQIRQVCDELLSAAGDSEAASVADVQFHRHIAEATGNELFLVLLDSLSDLMYSVRRATLRLPNRTAETYEQHDRIVRALEARDVAAGVEAMRAHLEDGYRTLAAALSS